MHQLPILRQTVCMLIGTLCAFQQFSEDERRCVLQAAKLPLEQEFGHLVEEVGVLSLNHFMLHGKYKRHVLIEAVIEYAMI